MRKFFLIIMGVLGILNVLAVQATEKFEVLPDLPESLSYAMPSAQAAAVTGGTNVPLLANQSVGSEPNLISVLLSLIFVVLLIYFTGIIYAKLNKVGFKTLKKHQGEYSRSQVSVVSTTQLGNNKTLHVVELDGKRMLIGASSSAIQLIKDLGNSHNIDDSEEYSHIEIPNIKIPKIEIPKIEIPTINFAKLATKTHKPIEEIDKDIEEKSFGETEVQLDKKEETSEEIIEKLFSKEEIGQEDVIEESVKSEHIVDPEDFALYKKYLN